MTTARILNLGFFLIQFLITIGFILKQQFDYIFNPLITSLFYLGVILLERFTTFKLKNYIRILLIITLSSHNLIGEYYNAYNKVPFFDNALHLFGIFSFSLFVYTLLVSTIDIKASRPMLLTFILVILLGIAMGTIFELMEFALDQFTNENNQRDLTDTDLDLLFDLIGALLAGIFVVSVSGNSIQKK